MIGVQNIEIGRVNINPQPFDILGIFNSGNGIMHVGLESALLPKSRFIFAVAQKIVDTCVVQKQVGAFFYLCQTVFQRGISLLKVVADGGGGVFAGNPDGVGYQKGRTDK